MAKLNLQVKGADAIINKLKNISQEAREDTLQITQATALEITRHAKSLAPVDTGKLRQSISNKRVGEFTYAVFSFSPYAPYMEFGTGRLTSVPEVLKPLARLFRGNGIREVNLRPQPFMYPAFLRNRQRYINDLKQLLKKYGKDFS
jgi:HK97 gp10 family phage protein